MSKGKEFDCLLGGRVELPSNINLLKFTAARCMEIQHMKKELKKDTGTKLVFQKLPKHMRRRVMSHNAKRLPRRLRESHINQMKKSGMPPKQKRLSRKYRRRPRNLQVEYLRRSSKNHWLETHIWHAKRFHMVEKWGYKLPNAPCDKAFRACYRATAKHCLINDISYYGCIEITGDEKIIKDALKNTYEPLNGLGPCARAYLQGNREGEFIMFEFNTKNYIGNVFFNYKPNNKPNLISIWFWAHTAYFEQVLNNLINIFGAITIEDGVYTSLNNVLIKDKRFELNRLQLTGPLSTAILHKILKPIDLNQVDVEWLTDFVRNDETRQIFSEQLNFWGNIKNLSSPAELPPKLIISLIVNDPRFDLNLIKSKVVPICGDFNDEFEIPSNLSFGPIWDKDICDVVSKNKLSNAAINEMRSKLLIPGSSLGISGYPVPVLVVQRPGCANDKSGYCSGYDIILPNNWTQPFWLSAIMAGAKAGGLRELNSIQFEMSKPSLLPPDTLAGQLEEKQISEERTKRFFSLPPNKRTNYAKLAITSPFYFDWKLLVQEWTQKNNVEQFLVLRNKAQLTKLNNAINGKKQDLSDINWSENYIVPVNLNVVKKGCIRNCAIICLPNLDDYEAQEPVEPLQIDNNQIKRKDIRDAHQLLLKSAKRKRKKARNTGKNIPIDNQMMQEYTRIMRELWLPKTEKIRNSCSRDIMGFVNHGDFSFTTGASAGVGYIALGALQTLISRKKCNLLLFRNTTSRQYRFAKVSVIV